jgi:hypothetical protein
MTERDDERWWNEEEKEALKAKIKRDAEPEGLPDGTILAWLQDTGTWLLSLNLKARDEEPEYKDRPILDVSIYHKPWERWIDFASPPPRHP